MTTSYRLSLFHEHFMQYIRSTGTAIVSDTERGDEMVIRLLELRRSLDIMIRDAFSRDDVFVYALRESFGHFINDKKSSSDIILSNHLPR